MSFRWNAMDPGVWGSGMPWLVLGLVVLGVGLHTAQEKTGSALALGSAVLAIFFLLLKSWSSPIAFISFWIWIHVEDLVRLLIDHIAVFFVKDVLLAALLIG